MIKTASSPIYTVSSIRSALLSPWISNRSRSPSWGSTTTENLRSPPSPGAAETSGVSVGSAAIERYLRPVCYQDLPQELLPQAIRDGNPQGLPRLVDGVAE